MECYRRCSGKTWERASLWERRALERYQEIKQDKRMRQLDPVLICTSRPDGSLFMAHFREKNAAVYVFVERGSDDTIEIEKEIMWYPLACIASRHEDMPS